MKRASYRAGVKWIAENDESGGSQDPEHIAGSSPILLLADLFEVAPIRVAMDVLVYRRLRPQTTNRLACSRELE